MPETKSKESLFNDLYKNAHTALQKKTKSRKNLKRNTNDTKSL